MIESTVVSKKSCSRATTPVRLAREVAGRVSIGVCPLRACTANSSDADEPDAIE